LLPRAHPSEVRVEAIRLARGGERPIRETALGLGISESCLRRWLDQDDVDGGRREGLSTSEREELSRLRREVRVLRQEREILKKAAAFFIKESETL
jgi:transposase-like protein